MCDPVDAGRPGLSRTGPGTLRGRGPPGGSGRLPATGPAPPPRGPGAPGEPASGVRAGREAGGGDASACPWRRSVSARRADPPTASTSAREELRGPCRICTVLTESGCRIAPSTYYAARSRPPSKRSISDAAPGSRGDPRPGGPSRFDAGAGDFREDLAAAGLPAGGPRVASMRRGCGACGRRSPAGAGAGGGIVGALFLDQDSQGVHPRCPVTSGPCPR